MADLVPRVGARFVLQHGPFRSMWEVEEVTPHGAKLRYVNNSEVFSGFSKLLHAPNGAQLVDRSDQDWVGSAHFESFLQSTTWPGRQETSRG